MCISKGYLNTYRCCSWCHRGEPMQFYFSDISCREGWGIVWAVCQTRILKDGGPPSSFILDAAGRLYGETGPQGYLSSGSNSPNFFNSNVRKRLISSIQLVHSIQNFYQVAETSGWATLADGNKNCHLPGQHSYTSPKYNHTSDSSVSTLWGNRAPSSWPQLSSWSFWSSQICSQALIIPTSSARFIPSVTSDHSTCARFFGKAPDKTRAL